MPAFHFPADRRSDIVQGVQRLTLAVPSTDLPRLGRPLTVMVGGRKLGDAVCVGRARIVIDRKGLRRVVSDIGLDDRGWAVLRLVANAENAMPDAAAHAQRLAQTLGHADWPALFAAERARGSGGVKTGRGLLARDVIVWAAAEGE